MRKLILGVIGAAFAFAMTAGVASATHNVPKDAKQQKGEFVKAYNQCVVPNDFTSNGFPACTGVVASDPKCTFSTKGKGKYLAKYNALGPDKLLGTSDDGDADIQATIVGLVGCNAQVLTIVADVRATTDDCTAGAVCTVVDLPNFVIAPCTVDSVGNCKIKTTVNLSAAGPILLPGKNVSIEVRGVSMNNGPNRLLRGGLLIK